MAKSTLWQVLEGSVIFFLSQVGIICFSFALKAVTHFPVQPSLNMLLFFSLHSASLKRFLVISLSIPILTRDNGLNLCQNNSIGESWGASGCCYMNEVLRGDTALHHQALFSHSFIALP